MKMPFEEKLLEMMEPLQEEYEAYEAFCGCLSLGLHIWMANFNTAEKTPFPIIEEIFRGALERYKDHSSLHFGTSRGDE